MGQKSRHKKNRKPQVSAQSSQSAANLPKAKVIMPASLRGVMSDSSAGAVTKPLYNKNSSPLDIQTTYIRSDILRICLLLILMALILTCLYVANEKTSVIHQAGQRLTSFMRL